jgi:hypothetical protein
VVPGGSTWDNTALTNAINNNLVVGKFDLEVDGLSDKTKFFISLPVSPEGGYDIKSVFGKQASISDQVLTFDIDGNVIDGALFDVVGSGNWEDFTNPTNPSTLEIIPGYGYGVVSVSGLRSITVVGHVLGTDSPGRTIVGQNGAPNQIAQWIGGYFPVQVNVNTNSTGLNVSTGGGDPFSAGTAYLFDADKNAIVLGWYDGGNVWTEVIPPVNLTPGKGYMFTEPNTNINWTQPKPY